MIVALREESMGVWLLRSLEWRRMARAPFGMGTLRCPPGEPSPLLSVTVTHLPRPQSLSESLTLLEDTPSCKTRGGGRLMFS